MATRCDHCGAVLDEKDDLWERMGLDRELCRDCIHDGYGTLGKALHKLLTKARGGKPGSDDEGGEDA